jgi:plastocyanin
MGLTVFGALRVALRIAAFMDAKPFATLARTFPRRLSRRAALRRLGAVSAGGVGLGALAASLTVDETPATLSPDPQTREFVLTASEFDWALMEDTTVRAWGYNGQVPGPELRVREGDRVRVTLRNQLPAPTTIHWHGVNLPPAMDGPAGLNQAAVEPGSEFVYDFIAKPAGSRWYHSHADPALQVPMGLYGPLIIEPRTSGPAYDRDYAYMMAEWDAELTPDVASGRAPRGLKDRMLRGGELGADFFLLNGRMHGAVPPIGVKEGDRVLIRLMNAGSMPHAFHTHGHSFQIVATDGNPIPEAARLTKDTVLIGPAERYDLAFVADNPGVWMVHCHMEHHMANGMMTLIAYEGAMPTGPAAAFYDPATGGIALGQAMPPGMDMSTPPALGTSAPTPAPVVDASAAVGLVANITMVDDRFVPNSLAVKVGATVVWTNTGADWHSVAAFDGSFSSDQIAPGETFSHLFARPGEFPFLCRHHGRQGMTGRIVVTA